MEERRFLVEGRQAVSELLKHGEALELYATADAARRHDDVLGGHDLTLITDRVAAALSETVTPQGLIAVAPLIDTTPRLRHARLVAVLVEPRDPGNAGTVIRVADAAGADAVLIVGDSVDIHNGKCVRAAAGSHFHLAIGEVADLAQGLALLADAGVRTYATAADGRTSLDALIDAGGLREPHAWVYGNEARGLEAAAEQACEETVSIPIYGQAESLNLATAAAVTLYASARDLRRDL
jgi:TrmH family RNA methyltransferase